MRQQCKKAVGSKGTKERKEKITRSRNGSQREKNKQKITTKIKSIKKRTQKTQTHIQAKQLTETKVH